MLAHKILESSPRDSLVISTAVGLESIPLTSNPKVLRKTKYLPLPQPISKTFFI